MDVDHHDVALINCLFIVFGAQADPCPCELSFIPDYGLFVVRCAHALDWCGHAESCPRDCSASRCPECRELVRFVTIPVPW